jgi:hypothetical protein
MKEDRAKAASNQDGADSEVQRLNIEMERLQVEHQQLRLEQAFAKPESTQDKTKPATLRHSRARGSQFAAGASD